MRDATKRPIADPNPHVVNSFAWNPEGTLARWSSDGRTVMRVCLGMTRRVA
jgi:hypothetical protein